MMSYLFRGRGEDIVDHRHLRRVNRNLADVAQPARQLALDPQRVEALIRKGAELRCKVKKLYEYYADRLEDDSEG